MNTENELSLERKLAVERAVEESDRTDLKQHAMKMLRDFEKFNDFSSNRAIWELVQNACDLSINCEITIDYRNDKFAFSHNGRPFNSNSLISLIKQVSGDKDEKSEIPPVGKYGTGFLTTHSLGRKFLINALLESSGYYIQVKDFLVDRSAKKWEDLSDSIKTQKDNVFNIIGTGQKVDAKTFTTTFTYLPETDQEKKYIAESFKDLEEYIPYILTINNRLKSANVIAADGSELIFSRLEKEPVINEENIDLHKTTVKINKAEKIIYSIIDNENEIEIILPIDKDHKLFTFSDRIARLFLYYPLVGSEHFGINFIINCNKFLPTEPRDAIHLKSNKDQVKDQEEINRSLIEKASDLLFKFLNSNLIPVINPLLYANIDFKRDADDTSLNEYFTELQEIWVSEFKNLNIIDTKDGYKNASEVTLLNPDLLVEEDYFDSIYDLAEKFYPVIPTKQTIKEWSTFISKWDYENATFINDENLAEKIQDKKLADFDWQILKEFYDYLLLTKHGNLFTDYDLLPNIEGDFQPFSSLKLAKSIDEPLIAIGKLLIPKSIEQLIDIRFTFSFNFDTYTRRNYSNSINTYLGDTLNDDLFCLPISNESENLSIQEDFDGYLIEVEIFQALLNYCKLHNNIDSQSKPSKLMLLISGFYNLDKQLNYLESINPSEEDLDIRTGQKKLVKLFFNALLKKDAVWIKNNLSFIYDVISYNEDRYKDVYQSSKIYPNQLFQLNLLTDLKRDINIEGEIYNLYNTVTKKEIGATLGHTDFNEFLIENDGVTNKTLTSVIEEIFFETDIHDINEHPFKNEILNIISKLNLPFYKDLFTRLNDNKAMLMLTIVTNERTKDDIFSIVTLKEDQLKKLGELIKQPNFEEILNQAENAVRLDKEKKSDFAHKYKIGTYIEDKIRDRLDSELIAKIRIDKERDLAAEDVQGGQDIVIIYDDIEIYFIEVKSRWDQKSSVLMSKTQLEKASENLEIYSLISVDVTKYDGENDKYQLSEEEIIPLIKVITTIGNPILPLIANNIVAERNENSVVKLVDYKGLINQDAIAGGLDFEIFVNYLVGLLITRIESLSDRENTLNSVI
jgi:hypothetical protein